MFLYEDLLASPEIILRKICDFLGVSFDERMLEYAAENKAKRLEPDESMSWKRKTFETIDTSRVGRYKQELLDEEIRMFEEIAGVMLAKYGYSLSSQA